SSDGIIAGNKRAVRFQVQIEVSVGQFRKRNVSSQCETPAGKIAAKLLNAERVLGKVRSRFKVFKRRKSRVAGTGHIHSHIGGAGEERLRDCSEDIDIQGNVAI